MFEKAVRLWSIAYCSAIEEEYWQRTLIFFDATDVDHSCGERPGSTVIKFITVFPRLGPSRSPQETWQPGEKSRAADRSTGVAIRNNLLFQTRFQELECLKKRLDSED